MAKIFTNNNKLMTIGNSFLCKYEPPLYNITYSQVANGTLSGPATAHANDTVNVIATPNTDYTLDYITVNGSQITGTSFSMPAQNSLVSGVFNEAPPVDPYNPLGLPPNTVRVRTSDGNPPTKNWETTYETATLVSGTTDVYDVYKSGTDFYHLFYYNDKYIACNVVEILGANTSNVTNMGSMFAECYSLTSVALFDTSNVTDAESMFSNCSALTSIPLFDTSNISNMSYMFNGCTRVTSGALALYQQASTQTTPPAYHNATFRNCGSNTTTGAAELAQIPSSWGGTGA